MESEPAPGSDATRALERTLREIGVPEEAIDRARARGRIEEAIIDASLGSARADRTVSPIEIERAGGFTVAEIAEIMLGFGLPAPRGDELCFTPVEAKALTELKQLRDVWPPEAYMQAARVYGQALGQIAHTEVQLFRLFAERRIRARDASVQAALPALRDVFERLLPLADPMLLGIHRRWVEHELAQAAVREVEGLVAGEQVPGAVQVALLFCDLKDFTAYAHARGDAAALDAIARFADVVFDERGEHGHLVKALGDGYMLSYPDAVAAVEAGARMIDRVRSLDIPPVHASVHEGVAVYHDGDYFGGAVNLAARLLALSGADELLGSRPVVESTRDRFAWEARGAAPVRGLDEPVEIFRLSAV